MYFDSRNSNLNVIIGGSVAGGIFIVIVLIIIVILLLYYYYTIRQENISRNIILLMGEKERERERMK